MSDGERVWYDSMADAFVGETIERDGIAIEIEHVDTVVNDPQDKDMRYGLLVCVCNGDG